MLKLFTQRAVVGQPLRRLVMAAVSFVAGCWTWAATAAWELNMPKGVTDVGREIYDLHMIIFWVCVVIGVLVFGVMIYSIIKHRKSVNPEPATFTHSTVAEVGWTVVPIVILIVMAFPAAKVLVKLEDTRNADLTVQVTGYQWNWHYKYADEGIEFYSKLSADSNRARQLNSGIDVNTVPDYLLDVDRPMVVPVNKKVVIKLTANDVIHAWWVPELGGKKDAIPGFINSMWFQANEIGTYRGQCSELCGRDHGFMPIVVEVVSEQDYANWVAERIAENTPDTQKPNTQIAAAAPMGAIANPEPQTVISKAIINEPVITASTASDGEMTRAELMKKGEAVYSQHCVACHQVSGKGLPPAFPALTGGAITTGPIEGHIENIVNGKPGTAMVAFGAQLSDAEIAAVVTYERNALGNSVGDQASPADVKAFRNK